MSKPSWATIIEALQSEEKITRVVAIGQLGNQSEPEAYDLLIQQLNQDDLELKCAAISSLGRLKDSRATKLLTNVLLYHEDLDVQVKSVEALWQIGDASALDALLEAASRKYGPLRYLIARALADIPDPRAFNVLMSYIKDNDPFVRLGSVLPLAKQAKALNIDVKPLLKQISNNDLEEENVKLSATIILEEWDTDLLD